MKLPLEEMTLREKLAVMEWLWEDLARSPESIDSPTWHKDVLHDRQRQASEGKARFADWEAAKAEIRSKIS